MNPNEKQSVPVVYVGNDDVVQHIKGIGPKKKTDAKVAQFAANQLAQSFGKPGKENRKNAADAVVSKSARKKKVKLDEPAIPQTTGNNHEAATNDKMKLFSFKTPKKSKQMSKFAEESARKSRAEKKAISHDEGSVKKKTSKSS
uniref:Uncharacterized protein n=1 Tax=Ciona savignyi TaxID=51511 RepID=H2ZIK1_CIOSA